MRIVTAKVTEGPIVRSVTATGTVNPEITVQLGTYVSGPIIAIYKDYNAPVTKGQLIAKIDPSTYQVTVDIAQATLANSKAQLGKDQADLAYKKVTYERDRDLYKDDAVSKDALDSAYSAWQMDVAQVKLDQANIQQQTANVKAAEVNLNYTNIVSPVDGTVVSRNVDVGQTVAASFQTPTLFLIAKDLTKMQVDSNISESDIGYVKDRTEGDVPRRRVSGPRFRGRRRAGPAGADHRAERRDLRRGGERRESRAAAEAGDDGQRERRDGVEGQGGAGADRRAALLTAGTAARGFCGADGAPGQPDASLGARRPQGHAGTITTGLSDGTWVEVADGDLQAGDRVVTDEVRSATAHSGSGSHSGSGMGGGSPLSGMHTAALAGKASAESDSYYRPMNTVIQIVGMTKTYVLGDIEVHALRGVDLTIERGEFVAVMGASGSGKSTLMNMLGCLDRPTSGRYILEGEDVAQLNESELATIRSKRIGFVFQNFNLLSRTSTLENVELPLFYSAWTADGEHRAADLVKLVGLAGREQNHPNQLSGGQQQRVAIARALVNRPSILLADEPTGNLDSTNSAEIMDVLTNLNRQQGITVIVVTHDPDVAAYADRTVTFRDGVIISDTRKEGAAGARRPRSKRRMMPRRRPSRRSGRGVDAGRSRGPLRAWR